MGLEETKQAIEAAGQAFQTWGVTTAKVLAIEMICRCMIQPFHSVPP